MCPVSSVLCLQLSSAALWCCRSRWKPIQQHQPGLQPTETLVMPPGNHGHKKANWKQITHTHTCDHIYTWNHKHRRENPHAGHCTCTYTHNIAHLITLALAQIRSHTKHHTHLHSIFQRPLRLPIGNTSGWEEEVSLLFHMKSMGNKRGTQMSNESGAMALMDRERMRILHLY